MSATRYPHIFLKDNQESRPFTTPRKGREPEAPTADRVSHSLRLKKEWDAIWAKAKEQDESRTAVAQPVRGGVYVEYEGVPGYDLLTKRLESRPNGIRLLNIYRVPTQDNPEIEVTRATVFIPTGKQNVFLKKLTAYAEENTEKGNPKNQPLMQSIGSIRTALLESLWTDDNDLMPNDSTAVWCEIWLSSAEPEVEHRFRETAASLGIETKNRILHFPERSVLLGCATKGQLAQLLDNSPDIAEFRRAKETPRFFLELENKDQAEWVKDLLSRTEINDEQDISVCVLDTGANNGHPLLEPLLSAEDCQSVDPSWGPADKDGHGTLMCGLSAYGDLTEALQSREPVIIRHKLESVRFYPWIRLTPRTYMEN